MNLQRFDIVRLNVFCRHLGYNGLDEVEENNKNKLAFVAWLDVVHMYDCTVGPVVNCSYRYIRYCEKCANKLEKLGKLDNARSVAVVLFEQPDFIKELADFKEWVKKCEH